MAFRVTVLDMETGEERVFVRNACGVICAMMCFGRKTEEGMDFQGVTRAEQMNPVLFAQCLDGVDRAIEKNCTDDAAVGMAYTLVKMGVMGDSLVDVEGETEEMSSSIKAHCGAEEVQA